MAIAISEKDGFWNKLIPHFIDGDSNELNPCFSAFKRINEIYEYSEESDNLIANLQLIGKASIRIDSLWV